MLARCQYWDISQRKRRSQYLFTVIDSLFTQDGYISKGIHLGGQTPLYLLKYLQGNKFCVTFAKHYVENAYYNGERGFPEKY